MRILKKLSCILFGHKYFYVCDIETPGYFSSKIWCPRCGKSHTPLITRKINCFTK